jgi:hypothetical protein
VTTKKLEPKQLLDRMRNEAAELLKYDLNKLTAAQSVRLDRAAALRLELDDVQSRQLAGLPIDMAKFVVASEALERLVGGNPETSTTGPDFTGAREELLQFLVQRADAIEKRREREEAKAIAAASIDGSKPASGDARRDHAVPQPALIEPAAAAGGPEPPVLVEPAPPPPQRVEGDIERMNRVNSTPALPPAREPEPWRKFVDADGNIISPWFIPHG